ncbi:MAG: peptidase M48 [Acidobacteria bacterium]|nr:MAG: peptidase M48 [Acidobacteriota bacterium]
MLTLRFSALPAVGARADLPNQAARSCESTPWPPADSTGRHTTTRNHPLGLAWLAGSGHGDPGSLPLKRETFLTTALLLPALLATACALNPATGRRQISLIGESQEIRMGTEADREISADMGIYQDPALAKAVADMGKRLAAGSERQDLPWSFKIVDEPVVNAFALPGGYIYVTRGILASLNSHGELAAVLGHEIGHVTARHSVNQMSKAQLAGLGLNLGTALNPSVARYAGLAGKGSALIFLKFGRDDERQADDLGLRYMRRAGFTGESMLEVFRMLAATGGGSSQIPGWLSTHPNPGDREERILGQISQAPAALPQDTVWLRLLEGLVFADDPRQGFFRGNRFLHPDLAFRIDFPSGWETANTRSNVSALHPEGKSVIELALAPQETPTAAATQFFSATEVQRGPSRWTSISGMTTVSASFRAGNGDEAIAGLVAFVALGDQVIRLLGATPASDWPAREATMVAALASFAHLTDSRDLNVTPFRLTLTPIGAATTLAEFHRAHPSTVTLDTVARINHLQPDSRIRRGMLIKRVIGGP